MKTTYINLTGVEVAIIDNGDHNGASLSSDLHDDEDSAELKAALDTVESLMLSLYCVGVDVTSPQICAAFDTTIQAIYNKFD